jgi:hypothetical protein
MSWHLCRWTGRQMDPQTALHLKNTHRKDLNLCHNSEVMNCFAVLTLSWLQLMLWLLQQKNVKFHYGKTIHSFRHCASWEMLRVCVNIGYTCSSKVKIPPYTWYSVSSSSVVVKDYATSRKVAGSRPDEGKIFINIPNPSGRTRPWCLLSLQEKWIQEAEKWYFCGVKRRPARKADKLTAISQHIGLHGLLRG